MRLKTLRKEQPAFEIAGAVINGNRLNLSNNELKPTKQRSNTSFVLPASLNTELSPLIISPPVQTPEMSSRSPQSIVIPAAPQSSKLSSYQAIEAACLERGIRIRVSPTRTSQQSGRKSVNSLQRHTAFVNRNPSRTSSVLHYTTTDLDEHHNSRSFSALQQTSSNDFQQTHTHNVSYAQSSQINEEAHDDDYLSPSIIASEHSHPMTPREKLPITNDIRSTTTLYDNDPDLLYMSSLLKKTNGDSFRNTIRRRAGLHGTFSMHRNPLIANPIQSQSRENSSFMNQNSLTRMATIAVLPTSSSSSKKIDKDILKHALRIRKTSQPKDYSIKSPRIDATSPPRITDTNKRNSINKPLKSISLEPLEFILSPTLRSASLSAHDFPSIKTSSKQHHKKSSVKRTKSAKILNVENENTTDFLSRKHFTSSSILYDESLSLMKTSPLDMAPQSNSFDSGCYDRSSSGGDVQSLTSSSIMQIPSSTPSARLTNSTARRSNTFKKVSFYEEPSTVIITTATYV